jgi:hypothetical protein
MAAKAKATAPVNDLSAWDSKMDVEATQRLVNELQSGGQPWDTLESDPKKYILNYRRICPKRPEWENPYQIVPVHYLGPSNRMVVCRKEAGLGECPACVLRWELHEAGAKSEERQLRASIRTFLNVVRIDKKGELVLEEGEDEAKVYLLGLNQIQFLGKRGVEYDPDEESELPLFEFFKKYGDLSSVVNGRDLLIKAKEEKSGDYDVLTLKFSVAGASPFPGTSELLESGLVNLQEVVTIIEPEEMMATIEGRATGAAAIAPPPVAAQITETVAAPVEENRFGGEEEEEAEAAPEEPPETTVEEEETDARAAAKPPKSDPAAAIARLRKNQKQE